MVKYKYEYLIVLVLIIIALFSGCVSDKEQYFSKRFNETLVLYSDNTFTLIRPEKYDLSGTYRVDGGTIVLIFPPFGTTERMTIKGDSLIYYDSEWVKI